MKRVILTRRLQGLSKIGHENANEADPYLHGHSTSALEQASILGKYRTSDNGSIQIYPNINCSLTAVLNAVALLSALGISVPSWGPSIGTGGKGSPRRRQSLPASEIT